VATFVRSDNGYRSRPSRGELISSAVLSPETEVSPEEPLGVVAARLGWVIGGIGIAVHPLPLVHRVQFESPLAGEWGSQRFADVGNHHATSVFAVIPFIPQLAIHPNLTILLMQGAVASCLASRMTMSRSTSWSVGDACLPLSTVISSRKVRSAVASKSRGGKLTSCSTRMLL